MHKGIDTSLHFFQALSVLDILGKVFKDEPVLGSLLNSDQLGNNSFPLKSFLVSRVDHLLYPQEELMIELFVLTSKLLDGLHHGVHVEHRESEIDC